MNPGRRAALHNVVTGFTALLAAALIFLHLEDRRDTIEAARRQVSGLYDATNRSIEDQVKVLVANLRDWEERRARGDVGVAGTLPEGFSTVKILRTETDAQGSFPTILPWMQEIKNANLSLLRDVSVATVNSETGTPREGEGVLGEDTPYAPRLRFPAGGLGRLTVTASIAAEPASPDAEPVPLEVLLQRGAVAPETMGSGPLLLRPGAGETRQEFVLDLVGADPQVVPHVLLFRVPPGSPPVKISWRAHLGTQSRREIHLTIPYIVPLDPAHPDGPRETVVVFGTVDLNRLAAGIRADLDRRPDFDHEGLGDRVYLTDASGTVALGIPDFDPRVKLREDKEGRSSLSSPATQKVRLRLVGSDSYEGFVPKLNVVGAYGPAHFINGGLIVERDEHRVMRPFRGVQAWHVAAALLGLLLLVPAVPPLWRRIREDTELPRLFAYAKPYTLHILVIILATIGYAVGTGVQAAFVGDLTDEILLSDEPTAGDQLEAFCWFLVLIYTGMFIVSWVREFLSKYIEQKIITDIRCFLCDKILQLPMAFHARQMAGDLLSRINNDVAETKRSLEMLFDDVIKQPFIIVALVGTAFWINWRLALIVFIGMPILMVPISYFGKSIKRHARKRQAKKALVTQAINQMLSGIRVVKAFRMEDHEAQHIRAVSDAHLAESVRVARNQVSSKEILEFVQNLSAVVVLATGGYLVLEGSVTVGDLIAFIAIIGKVYKSSKDLTSTYNKMQESLAGAERIFEVLDTPDEMADRPTARALVRPRESVTFEGVEFRYDEKDAPVLKDIDFRAQVGTTVALVGPTGAGKSTLLDLVARFYDPTKGRVAIDGVDLRDYSRTSLMSQVAVVTQDPFLFNATIAENIRYGRRGATQAEIEAAARAAYIHEEILRQPDGYETVVGERGGRLSGGQRQRITIARAILKDPPILILDEATSALDSRAEKRVQDALHNLMNSRTTFVIAHRLSTIQHADRILVLEGGRIVESGTHEDLLRMPKGRYRELYEIQFSSALQAPPAEESGSAEAVAG